MKQRGFSLVELLIVISITSILAAMGSLHFSRMKKNAQIESQTKEIYADLLTIRSQALFQRTDRSVTIPTATSMWFHADSTGGGVAILQRTFTEAISSNNTTILAFDADGVSNAPATTPKAYCIGETGNSAGVDSIVISTTSIMLGKLTTGACNSANISPR